MLVPFALGAIAGYMFPLLTFPVIALVLFLKAKQQQKASIVLTLQQLVAGVPRLLQQPQSRIVEVDVDDVDDMISHKLIKMDSVVSTV